MTFVFRLIAASVAFVAFSTAFAASSFDSEAICRTAIGSIMDRDPKAMQVTQVDGDVIFLTYIRALDNFSWTYRCRISGNRVLWGIEPGRWREDLKDDKIFFEILGAGNQLRIIEHHVDGSTTRVVFDRAMIL